VLQKNFHLIDGTSKLLIAGVCIDKRDSLNMMRYVQMSMRVLHHYYVDIKCAQCNSKLRADIATESNTIRQAQRFLQRERQRLQQRQWLLKEQQHSVFPRVFVFYLYVVVFD